MVNTFESLQVGSQSPNLEFEEVVRKKSKKMNSMPSRQMTEIDKG